MPEAAGSVFIRPAVAADAGAIAGLSAQLGYPADAPALGRRLERLVAAPAAAVWVAAMGSRIVGWAHVEIRLLVESAEFAEIGGLVVDAATRRSGIGTRLVEACRQWASAQGVSALRVRSNVVREEAHRFYERQGFTRLKAQAVFSRECS